MFLAITPGQPSQPWMISSLKGMKGSEEDLAPIREFAFAGMLKVMKADQIKTPTLFLCGT